MKVLLVEDDEVVSLALASVLIKDGGFEVQTAGSLSEARDILNASGPAAFDMVLLDLALPESEGLNTLEAIQRVAPSIPIVIITSSDDEEQANESLVKGAQDYLVKGQHHADKVVQRIRYAFHRHVGAQACSAVRDLLVQVRSTISELHRMAQEYRALLDVMRRTTADAAIAWREGTATSD